MNCTEAKGKADASDALDRLRRMRDNCVSLVGVHPWAWGDWLRSLGLGQYEAVFRESEIDPEVLAELTGADLEKLGVPLGHRKRLLNAISNLASLGQPTSSGAAS